VSFTNMDLVGRNPARLIPAYHDFIRTHAPDRPSRGVGEPIGPHRRGPDLVECEIHEALCNLAFTTTGWWVLCPYDVSALPPPVIDEARRNHPYLLDGRDNRGSPAYRDPKTAAGPLGEPLPEPPARARQLVLRAERRHEARRFVSHHARAAGLDRDRTSDLVLAVDTIASNGVRDGAVRGVLSLWRDGARVLVEVRDRHRVTDPLVGRQPPGADSDFGWALRAANQLCDLMQVRADVSGTAVRLHVELAAPGPTPG
jgi:hypothetical protein